MADIPSISGTDNPYVTGTYTPEKTDKNSISMSGYFKLLAAQLQNQDMTNPMDNSEIMAQMTQMAMVQSLTSMTEAVENSSTLSTQTYAASLIGQEVTMAVTEENSFGQETPVDVKYARVESINFTSGSPTIIIEGDSKEYELSHLLGVGKIPNPYKKEEENPGENDPNDLSKNGTEGNSVENP